MRLCPQTESGPPGGGVVRARGQSVEEGRSGGLPPRWIFLSVLLAATGFVEPSLVFLGFVALLGSNLLAGDLSLAAPPLRLVLPALLLVALGTLSAWGGGGPSAVGFQLRDVVRDAWRYGEPALLVLLGWNLLRRESDLRHLLAAVLLAAAMASAAHLIGAILHFDQLGAGRDAFRQEVGSGSFLSALALALSFGLWLEGARPPRLPFGLQRAAVILCGASLALSFSRTWWLALMVLVAILIIRRGGVLQSAGASLVTLSALIAGALLAAPEDVLGLVNGGLKDAMVETMTARSFVEPSELNRFWRSYEAYCALQHLEQASPLALAVGDGLGAKLDLGLYQLLDGELRREIPVLHNGYFEATLKVGLFGLGIYLFWLCAWIRGGLRAARHTPSARVIGGLTVGLALVLVGTGQVVGGAFNPRATAGIIVILAAFSRWSRLVQERGPSQGGKLVS